MSLPPIGMSAAAVVVVSAEAEDDEKAANCFVSAAMECVTVDAVSACKTLLPPRSQRDTFAP